MTGNGLQAHARSLLWQAWAESAEEIASAAVEVLAGRGMLVEEGGAAELEKLRARVAELETFAHGCDAEGCVLPHSSWCERAKKTAAENDGCTCGEPWQGHPQTHAGHCWLLSPPRDEVERLRRAHAEDGAQLAKMRATNTRLRGKVAEHVTANLEAANRAQVEIDRLRAETAADHRTWQFDLGKLRKALAEVERLRAQRRFLVEQVRRKDAASGEGNRALAEFLAGYDDDTAASDAQSDSDATQTGHEYGVRYGDDIEHVDHRRDRDDAEQALTRWQDMRSDAVLVQRTVRYGPWRPVEGTDGGEGR
ncbi:hypothetical protein [Streptomyces phytophilus]|uniref:hypothetical protein n=1 Tax=Streptomyces phytophilus TaxID=722715 RepID=UPI0015F0569F|nr:hypothetical protein [Streptomyces phytophilus]